MLPSFSVFESLERFRLMMFMFEKDEFRILIEYQNKILIVNHLFFIIKELEVYLIRL